MRITLAKIEENALNLFTLEGYSAMHEYLRSLCSILQLTASEALDVELKITDFYQKC